MTSQVRGSKNPFGEQVETVEVMRSKMIEVVSQRRLGAARESFNPWTTNEFDQYSCDDMQIPQSVQDHDLRVWSKARVLVRFAKKGVDTEKISPEIFEEIVGVLFSSKQLMRRALRRYVDWTKMPDQAVFGDFAPAVEELRSKKGLTHVNTFLDALAKSSAAPKKPNGKNGKSNGSNGGTRRIEDMSIYEIMALYGSKRMSFLDPGLAGTPPMAAIARESVVRSNTVPSDALGTGNGLVESIYTYTKGLGSSLRALAHPLRLGGMALCRVKAYK